MTMEPKGKFTILENNMSDAEKDLENIVMDQLNNMIYLDICSDKERNMQRMLFDNSISNKVECIRIEPEVAMNIVGNNIDIKSDEKNTKTKGILYKDFCSADNLLILLSGKVIVCRDLMEKEIKPAYVVFEAEEEEGEGDKGGATDFYGFSNEPVAVWMSDKEVIETKQRWKIVVAFRNGHVKELVCTTNSAQGTLEGKLVKYLISKEDKSEEKLPGTIKKIFRNRHSLNQPVYFLMTMKEEGEEELVKEVLATIEFQSQTLRQFQIPFTETGLTRYIILNIEDDGKRWQDILCVISKTVNDVLTQRTVHARVRIGRK